VNGGDESWLLTKSSTDRDRGKQAFGCLQLQLFSFRPGFESLMKLFNQPARISRRLSLYAAQAYARNANPIAYLGGNHVDQNKNITG